MRTEAEAIEGDVLRCLVNASNHGGFVLQFGTLRSDQAEHHLLAVCHIGQGGETARAFVVEFEVEGIDLFEGKERLRHSVVGSLARPVGMIVAAAHVGGDHHTFGTIFERQIVQTQARSLQESRVDVRIENFEEVVIAKSSPSAVVQLDVAATGSGQIADHRAIGGSDVLNQLFVLGIDGRRGLGVVAAKQFGVELCRRGKGLACHNAFALKLFHELEVLDEGMLFAADLAREATRAAGCFGFVELIAVFQLDVFHALETPSEIEVPITATELTVGDHL